MKRARFFLTAPDAENSLLGLDPSVLRRRLLSVEPQAIKPKQLSLDDIPGFQPEVFKDAVMGQF
jgi:hypothetical protein